MLPLCFCTLHTFEKIKLDNKKCKNKIRGFCATNNSQNNIPQYIIVFPITLKKFFSANFDSPTVHDLSSNIFKKLPQCQEKMV